MIRFDKNVATVDDPHCWILASARRQCLCAFVIQGPLLQQLRLLVWVVIASLGASFSPTVALSESEPHRPLLSGEAAYNQYCAPCHGNDGLGNGRLTFSLSKPVPDLTQLSARNGGVFPRERLTKVVDGREQVAAHKDREMPVSKSRLFSTLY